MTTVDCQGYGPIPFDTGAVVVNDASNWIQVGLLVLAGTKEKAVITFNVGAGGALSHLKLTRASQSGGSHVDWLVDAALNTVTAEVLDATAGLSTLAANGVGQMEISNLGGAGEIGIWAKKATADTTLQAIGTTK